MNAELIDHLNLLIDYEIKRYVRGLIEGDRAVIRSAARAAYADAKPLDKIAALRVAVRSGVARVRRASHDAAISYDWVRK